MNQAADCNILQKLQSRLPHYMEICRCGFAKKGDPLQMTQWKSSSTLLSKFDMKASLPFHIKSRSTISQIANGRRFKSCVIYLAYVSYLKLSIRFCISTIEITKNVGYLVWAKFADYFLQNEIVLMSISNVTDCAPFSPHLLHEVRWLWQKELQKTGTLDFFLSTYSSGNQTLPKKSKSKTSHIIC